MAEYTLKTGVTQRLFFELVPVRDLASATVKASMRVRSGADVFIDRAAQVANGTYTIDGVSTPLTPASGVVFVDITATDTVAAGFYEMEFIVTYSGGFDDVLPSASYIPVTITARI